MNRLQFTYCSNCNIWSTLLQKILWAAHCRSLWICHKIFISIFFIWMQPHASIYSVFNFVNFMIAVCNRKIRNVCVLSCFFLSKQLIIILASVESLILFSLSFCNQSKFHMMLSILHRHRLEKYTIWGIVSIPTILYRHYHLKRTWLIGKKRNIINTTSIIIKLSTSRISNF